MTITNGYCTLSEFYARYDALTADSGALDARIRRHINAASRWIDRHCDRHFYALTDTREFTAYCVTACRVRDLVSVTTLATDEDGDRTYETTWGATDYELLPYNDLPYQEIEITPDSTYTFPLGRRGVQVVGVWGWPVTSTTSSATLNEDLDASETAVDVSSGAVFEAGTIIRIDSEDMAIDSISTNTLTVRRGVNGTTAATHSTGAAIAVLTPPDDIKEACLMQASRLFAREKTVLGVSSTTALGTMTVRTPKDEDIHTLLDYFVRRSIR